FSPDSQLIGIGDAVTLNTGLNLYDISTGGPRGSLTESAVYSIAFSPDGKSVLTHTDAGIQIISVADRSRITLFNQETDFGAYGGLGQLPVAFSPDGSKFFYG